jgi:hypothetical protein
MTGRMDKLRFIHMTRMTLDVWYALDEEIKNIYE